MTKSNQKSNHEKKQKVILLILDGFGYGRQDNSNAIYLAQPKTFNSLIKEYPNISINASEEFVGLPQGQPGNSEVGHLTIGAGRIFYTGLGLINNAIKTGEFFDNTVILNAINEAKTKGTNLHLLGLASNGDVHASLKHLYALIDLCNKQGVTPVLDLFTDGRDTKEKQFQEDFKDIKAKYLDTNKAKLGSISGRYYAMDRNKNWDRTELALEQIKSVATSSLSPEAYIQKSYDEGVYDEFIKPLSFNTEETKLKDNDVMIFFNFRSDRIRQLIHTFTKDTSDYDYVSPNQTKVSIVGFMDYKLNGMKNIAFIQPVNTIYLGDLVSQAGLTQLRIAETEKYAHVTYFLDSMSNDKKPGCDFQLIPSPDVATYDLKPEMSASQITDFILANYKKYDLVVANYANSDMVGHTGVMNAAINAIKTLDEQLERIYQNIVLKNPEFTVIITADHGNSDEMIDKNGIIETSHTTNKVPFILLNKDYKLEADGSLANITPTILDLLGVEKPDCMINSLIKK